MAAGASQKVSAAAARSHTGAKQGGSNDLPSGIMKTILAVSFVGILAWAYQAIQPPPPNELGELGSPGGLQITAPRIRLRDGRHLAYKEHGVPKHVAKYKVVYVHGFDSCRHDTAIFSSTSKETIDELGVYVVSFDRPGYGESDPDPKRTPKSISMDIEELADQLGLGSRFYVIGVSMGGELVWGCLKYIPHRLAGAALLAPVVNYWWPGFPSNLSTEAYNQQLPQDQWTLRVAHYIPWLTYWWNTQKWFPSSSVIVHSAVLSPPDMRALSQRPSRKDYVKIVRHQGEYESVHRDLMVGFGSWEFDPMDLENPFPNNEGSVHLWHGDDDLVVPASLPRFIAQKLPWIRYHELTETGHMFPFAKGTGDVILKQLLAGEK